MFQSLQTTLVMTVKIAILAFVFAAFTTQAAGPDPKSGPFAEKPKKAKYAEGELLVRFKGEVGDARAEAVHGKFKARKLRQYKSVKGLQHVKLPKGLTVEAAVAKYKKDPNVAYAEPNYFFYADAAPDDPRYPELWNLNNTGQTGGTPDADINAPEAWDHITGDPSVVVAVIDSGIDYTHEDLIDNMWVNDAEFTGKTGEDDDDNGYVDDIHGINSILGTPGIEAGDPLDDFGHGTHVAGIIAARGNNGIGISGVVHETKLIACKFLNQSGAGLYSDALKCLDYLVELKTRATDPVNIIASNNSWGGDSYSQALLDGIKAQRDAGILFIASAGNGGEDQYGDNNDVKEHYPAGYDVSNLIAVAATDHSDVLGGFSNYGRHSVHVAAPGVDILSSWITPTYYRTVSGTSMAAPHVTGLAALLKAQDPSPSRDWRVIKNLLLAGSQVRSSVRTRTITGGRIRAWDQAGLGVGALNCSNQVVLRRLRPTPDTILAEVGDTIKLSALHIDCALPNGDVLVSVVDPVGGTETITLLDDGQGADEVADDGVYTANFQPDKRGTYELTFPDWDTGSFPSGDVLTVAVARNYQPATPVAADYRLLTSNKVDLNLGNEQIATINTPFPIQFAGDTPGVTTLYVADNGYIGIQKVLWPFTEPRPLPTSEIPDAIAPMWLDLNPALGGAVYWEVMGAAPYQELVVEWADVPYDTDDFHQVICPGSVKFQIVFFENSPNILFNYADVDFVDGTHACDSGRLASVGIQVSELVAQRYSYKTPDLSEGLSLWWRLNANSPNPPTAGPQSVTVIEDSIDNPIMLSGSDPDGDFLLFAIVSGPSAGTLTGRPPNVFYSPAENYTGADSFTFSVSDGALTSTPATVSINVTDVDDPPVADAQSVTVAEDSTANSITLTGSDIEGASLSFTVTAPVNGTLTGIPPDVSYQPDPNFDGVDTFSFVTNDGLSDSAPATVTINVTAVNDAPVAIPQSQSTAEDTALAITLAATDADDSNLDYTVIIPPANGTLSGTPPNVTYTPAQDYVGTDNFKFQASDGSADSNIATVVIDVTAANDAPVADDQAVAVEQNTNGNEIVFTGSDVDGDPLTFSVVTGPTNGTLGPPNSSRYTPNIDFTGTDSFTFKANDGALDSNNTATVTITVVAPPVSGAPTATGETLLVGEDGSVTGTLTATDPESDTLSYEIVTAPRHGTLNPFDPGSGSYTYTPHADYNGSDRFTFRANDGMSHSNVATIDITVTAGNDAPTAVSQRISVAEDGAGHLITLDGNDIDGDALVSFDIVSGPSNGTLSPGPGPSRTYTPAADFNGTDSFTFTVNDGTVDSTQATVTIHVVAVNDAPIATVGALIVNEDTTATDKVTATDLENDTLAYRVVTPPRKGIVAITNTETGAYRYTPDPDYNGLDQFSFRAYDGSADSNVATVAITINPINDAPVAHPQTVIVTEDQPQSIVLAGSDIDSVGLSFMITADPGYGVLSGTPPDVVYTPALNFSGTDSFEFAVGDGSLTGAPASVTIAIDPVNDEPVAGDGSLDVPFDTATNGMLPGSDPDPGDTLTYRLTSNPTKGVVLITNNRTGAYRYTPDSGATGADSFSYEIEDAAATVSNVATIAVTISDQPPPPPPPVAAASSSGGGGGCSLGRSGGVDPVLPLLFALSSLYALRRRVPGARRLAAARCFHTGN